MSNFAALSAGLNQLNSTLEGKLDEFGQRLFTLEQHGARPSGDFVAGEGKSLGEIVTSAPQVKTFFENRMPRSGKVMVGNIFATKTAIVNVGNLFAPPQRVPDISAIYQPLRIRSLLRVTPATSNLVEFVREDASTTINNAAPQGAGSSPFVRENVAKAESQINFVLVSLPVETIAHWIPCSRQALSDSQSLSNFLNSRMIFFLQLVEEQQLLTGSGTGGNLLGLLTTATPFDTSTTVAGDTKLDTLARAIEQVQASGFSPNAVVLHPKDWNDIRLIKTTGTALNGSYVFSPPSEPTPPAVWNIPVVLSVKMPVSKFLILDGQNACELFDREQATVEISYEHADFFIKNMAAILVEERIVLATYQPDGMRAGTFSGSMATAAEHESAAKPAPEPVAEKHRR
jgi:HK97 family phage major capsid protein